MIVYAWHIRIEKTFLLVALIAGAASCLLPPSAMAFDYFQSLPDQPLVPANNPISHEKADLGKILFFDTRLSKDGKLACNSCHSLTTAASDGMAVSPGADGKFTRRSSPSLLNIGLQTVYYWDGRSKSLEDLFLDHLAAADIMAVDDFVLLERRIQAIPGYRTAFSKAFNSKDAQISVAHMAQAVATFLRTLLTPGSRYDQFIQGDVNALSALEKTGMELFRTVGCLACHFGVNFAGPAPGPALHLGDGFYELFPNHTGTIYDEPLHLLDDLGIFEVSNNPQDKRLWRVPPLRNIALTAPYFHNGSAADLETAIKVMALTQLRKELHADEIAAIRAFLESLTGTLPEISLPSLPVTPGISIQEYLRW